MTSGSVTSRSVTSRPATPDDVPALTELQRASDTHWFGAPEHDEAEVREELDLVDDLVADSRLWFDGDQLLCFALRGRHESSIAVRPGGAAYTVLDDALNWLTRPGPTLLEVLDRDTPLSNALAAQGWRHTRSAFELARPVADDWPAAHPAWPAGTELRHADAEDLESIHHLIYVDARYADIPGHMLRDFDEWRRLFLGDRSLRDSVVLACRDGHPVGVSIVGMFSDGQGWISQLAVAGSERGRGLGRALVLESLRRLVAGGATALGLGVQAENRGALGLYLALGLQIEREWQVWESAAT